MNQRNLVPGLLLIGLGSYLALVQLIGLPAESVVAVFGAGFLVAYAMSRNYGFLVVGGIMTGLGLGIIWEAEFVSGGAPVVIGLGLGFLSIYLVDLFLHGSAARWWPVIPGGILTFVGALSEAQRVGYRFDETLTWAVLLIGLGVLLLLAQLRGRHETPQAPTEQPGTGQ